MITAFANAYDGRSPYLISQDTRLCFVLLRVSIAIIPSDAAAELLDMYVAAVYLLPFRQSVFINRKEAAATKFPFAYVILSISLIIL